MREHKLGYHETHGYLNNFNVDTDKYNNVINMTYNWTDDRDEAMRFTLTDERVVSLHCPFTITFISA